MIIDVYRGSSSPVRLVTSLYMIIDIQAGKAEFKLLWRWLSHNFPNISNADSPKWTRDSWRDLCLPQLVLQSDCNALYNLFILKELWAS